VEYNYFGDKTINLIELTQCYSLSCRGVHRGCFEPENVDVFFGSKGTPSEEKFVTKILAEGDK